jgi:ankyrin repeat protein
VPVPTLEEIIAVAINSHPLNRDNSARTMARLIEAGGDIQADNVYGQTQEKNALHWAVYRQNEPLVAVLIAAGADVNAPAAKPLAWAVVQQNFNIIKMLLDAGADPTVENWHGNTLLGMSVKHADILQLLIERGADVNAKSGNPLRQAATYGAEDSIARLLAAGANVNASDSQLVWNKTALSAAAAEGYTRVVAQLLAAGADVHVDGDRAIVSAARCQDSTVTRMLVDAGADVRAHNNQAIVNAAEAGNNFVVRALIEFGADVQAQDNEALIQAAKRGHPGVVALLLAAGADVQARGNEALMQLCLYSNNATNDRMQTLRILLSAGADVHARGDEAAKNALFSGSTAVLHLLEEAANI